jgi:hypothetical protein
MSDWKWSPAEKIVARRAFDVALNRELETVIREAKERAARIREASDLWEIEGWLAEQRRRIDRTFDFRYSVLPLVFATLFRNRRLDEDELRASPRKSSIPFATWCTPEQQPKEGDVRHLEQHPARESYRPSHAASRIVRRTAYDCEA